MSSTRQKAPHARPAPDRASPLTIDRVAAFAALSHASEQGDSRKVAAARRQLEHLGVHVDLVEPAGQESDQ